MNVNQWGPPLVAFDGTNHVAASGSQLARVAPDGTVLPPLNTANSNPRALAYDGTSLHAFFQGTAAATAIGRHGIVDATTGAVTGLETMAAKLYVGMGDSARNQNAFFCGVGAGCLSIWADDDGKGGYADILGARFAVSGGLQDPARGVLLSFTADAASTNAAVASPTQGLALFQYDEGPRWNTDIEGPVRASRISAAGVLLDPAGVELSPSVSAVTGTPLYLAGASNGTDFLAVWTVSGELQARRLSSAGALLEAAPIDVANAVGKPNVVFDGTNYGLFFAYGLGSNANGGYRRLSPAGTFVDAGAVALPRHAEAVAFNGTNYLLAWQEYPTPTDIRAIRMAVDGTFLDAQPFTIVTGNRNHNSPWAASDGKDWFVIWRDQRNGDGVTNGATYGARITAAGAVLDANGFSVAEEAFGSPGQIIARGLAYDAKIGKYIVAYDRTEGSNAGSWLATVSGTTVSDRTKAPGSIARFASFGTGPAIATYASTDTALRANRNRARILNFGGAASSSSSGGVDGGADGGSSSGASSSGASSSGASSNGGASSSGASSNGGASSSNGSSSGGATPSGDDGGGSCTSSGRGSSSWLAPLVAIGALLGMRRRGVKR